MATYYNGNSEIQGGDGLQTLVLMNPGYVYYSDSQQSTQSQPYGFLDSNHHTNHPVNSHHHHTNMSAQPPSPAQTQQLVGIPLSTSPPSSIHSQHFIPRAHMYTPVEMVPVSREVNPFQQGLSLSLSSEQTRCAAQAARVPISPNRGSTSSGVSNNMLLNSKYLKATQEVLEEVVNVALKNYPDRSTKNLKITGDDGGSPPAGSGEAEIITKSSGSIELTTAQRQEIQMKKAKLVNMLDEVEQRYKQYHHQMQVVISWFEQAAGIGSAKTYTSLALQTISKQFRCLKDTIVGQIKAASLSLGEEDGKADGGGSRLKFVDNQIRQQRALHQLGMIHNNAWRPQRGLPERAVSVLRAWLFEHFLHPYPKDSDKHMLAKQTGLTRSQVSNWFINARVRLWKPMVEEMYLEETKEQENNKMETSKTSNNNETEEISFSKQEKTLSPENSNRGLQTTKQEKPFHPQPSMPISTSINFQNQSGFSLIGPLEMDGITQFTPKKPRNEMQQQNHDGGYSITNTNPTDFMGGLGGYPIDQIQQHYSGNGVSLTLGLPHNENISISGSHHTFLPNQTIQPELGEENDYTTMNPPSSALYESMNMQNRKRFAAQPLPDFVA